LSEPANNHPAENAIGFVSINLNKTELQKEEI